MLTTDGIRGHHGRRLLFTGGQIGKLGSGRIRAPGSNRFAHCPADGVVFMFDVLAIDTDL
ncbi:hypothetical protein D3C74_475730 [compost metagenome]